MGTQLYERLGYRYACFEELNATAPQLVQSVHRSYIEAGAEIIETDDRLDNNAGQGSRINREPGLGCGQGDEPGADPSSTLCRQPRRSGHHRPAKNESMPSGVFVAFEAGPG